jgi:hypothetical protein
MKKQINEKTNPVDAAVDVQNIVSHPWDFACKWYRADDIYRTINCGNRVKPVVPTDVTSREFAEWLANEYRLAMRKGAELATEEMQRQS